MLLYYSTTTILTPPLGSIYLIVTDRKRDRGRDVLTIASSVTSEQTVPRGMPSRSNV
jgi:hypothetical protein